MATEKQVSMFSHHINVNRGLTRTLFPDRLVGGANLYRRDSEGWAREQDSQVIWDIIKMFMDDKPEMAIDQIKHLMK